MDPMRRTPLYFLAALALLPWTLCSHFRGGIITWKPAGTGNPLEVTLNFRLGWRRDYNSQTQCSDSTISSGTLIGIGSMVCQSGCSGTVGTAQFQCTDYSVKENWSTGENSYNYVFPNEGPFLLGHTGNAWISLVRGGGSWSLLTYVNLTARADIGKINTSPQSSLTPLLRLQKGCNHTITIPVNDPDGDIVRCRWATGRQECGGVCGTFEAEGAVLNQAACEIKFYAQTVGWHAVALIIEDFPSTAANSDALSRVPLQFLVNVFSSSQSCAVKPVFVGYTPADKACIGVPFNTTWTEDIVARTGAKDITVNEITTISPPGLTKSSLVESSADQEYFVTVTWSPQPSQFGANIFCFTASDSIGLSSNQRCVTLLGGVHPPYLDESSLSPMGEVLPDHNRWTMKFDKQFVRPTERSVFVRFFTENGDKVLNVDTSYPRDAVFPISPDDRTLEIRTTFRFQEKEKYYILLDAGIVKGTTFCGADSLALKNSSIWQFRIKDITPPTLTFTSRPFYTNSTTSLSWTFDEEVTQVCTLQLATVTSPEIVPCNNSWTRENLPEGTHTIFIDATDLAGNVAPSVRHNWRVDLTPPSVILNTPDRIVSKATGYTFRFSCNEPGCNMQCELLRENTTIVERDCSSGSFSISALVNEMHYHLRVTPTDRVKNVGLVKEAFLQVDTTDPNISGVPTSVSLTCGDNTSPNNSALGTPVISDNLDPTPVLNYTDRPGDGCSLQRVWSAFDEAGNSKTLTQTITFTGLQAPTIDFPADSVVPCSVASELTNQAEELRKTVNITHPCNRPVNVTYQDSTDDIDRCGFTFTRTWTVTDDCGQSVSNERPQTIRVLPLLLPVSPQVGQINVVLNEPLEWPQYPSATQYQLFLWKRDEVKPLTPVTITSQRSYQPQMPYAQNTQFLWQIGYVVPSDNGTDIIPSPVWGFQTKPFPDLRVASITVPDSAYSGQSFVVSWTVENIGAASTGVYTWYDAVYIGNTPTLNRRRRMVVRRNQLLDPNDGYVPQATVNLVDSDLGTYYIHVQTDIYNQVNDVDRTNNLVIAPNTVNVRLTPPPDLVVQSVFGPGSTFSGQEVQVSWKVTNTGTGRTKVDRWWDSVYLSLDNMLDDDDDVLARFTHTGVLAPGGSYEMAMPVYINHRIFGNYFFIVQTDVFNNVYEHSGDQNGNIKSSEEHTEVVLTPPPDLEVTSLTVESNWVTGQQVIIQYEVTNNGFGKPFEPWWNDQIALINLDTNKKEVLQDYSYSSKLDSGESYTRTKVYAVSSLLTNGEYNLTVMVDSTDRVFEYTGENNNRRIKAIQIQQQLPDLAISPEVNYSLNETEYGVILTLAYNVSNIGLGRTLKAPWVDRVSLTSLDQKTKIVLGTIEQANNVMAGQGYSASGISFAVVSSVFGNFFITIDLDFTARLHESSRSNNQIMRPITVPQILPDFQIVSFSSDISTIQAGNKIKLSWSVENIGRLKLIDKTWHDSVFLSASEDSEQQKLYDQDVSLELSNGETYEITSNVTIPIDASGTSVLWIQVNSYKALQEKDLTNNIKTLNLNILSPPSPNLHAQTAEFQFDDSSRLLTVTWSVKNTGNSMVSTMIWKDQVSIEDSTLSYIIGDKTLEAKLESNQEYRATSAFVIPRNLAGVYTVVVTSDAFNNVVELNGENNNVYKIANTLTVPDVLRQTVTITFSNVEATVESGQQFSFTYTVQNTDSRDIQASSWTDLVYIASSSTANEKDISEVGFQLARIDQTDNVPARESYTKSFSVVFPYGILGNVHLYIIVDANDQALLRTSANPSAAFHKASTSIQASEGPLPDIYSMSSPGLKSLRGGQPFTVSINISNSGYSDVSLPFYSSLYLSEDITLDPFDLKLAVHKNEDLLSVNGTVPIIFKGFAPFDTASGNYYLIIDLDSRGEIFEVDETNNQYQFVVTFLEVVSTDIAVVSVDMSSASWTFDSDVTIDWTIRNNGSLQAEGYRCDTAYLSDDNKWDITDPQIGNPACSEFSLPPYAGLNDDEPVTVQNKIPLVAPGGYYGAVRTRSNIRDVKLDNNIGFTTNTEQISLPVLQLEAPLTNVAIISGKTKAYVIPNVPADETLIVELQSANPLDIHDLYVRFDKPASAFSFDGFSALALSANQEVIIENTELGSYYLLVENNGEADSSATLSAKIAKFELRRADPSEVSSTGNVTLRLQGTLFKTLLDVRLKYGQKILRSLGFYPMSSTEVYATFDMRQATPGEVYDIMVTDIETNTVTMLSQVVRVKFGKAAKLSSSVQQPRALRPGETGTIIVNYQNVGDVDMPSPQLKISLSGVGQIKLLGSDRSEIGNTFLVLASPLSGPGGILRPRSSGRLTLEVSQAGADTGRTNIDVQQVTNDDMPHVFSNQKSTLKPSGTPDNVWELVWENFIAAVGTTRITLNNRLSSLANTLAVVGRRPMSVNSLVDYLLKMADGSLAGVSLVDVFDIDDKSFTKTDMLFNLRRSYSPSLSQRRMKGPFGYGWASAMLESRVAQQSPDEVIVWHAHEELVFTPSSEEDGSFTSNTGQRLVDNNEGLHLYHDNTIFSFNKTSNLLMKVRPIKGIGDVTLHYNTNDQLQKMTHTEGSTIAFQYNENGLVSSAEHIDSTGKTRSVQYVYDSASVLLTEVVTDDVTVRYSYTSGGDLTEVTHPLGGSTIYGYNENNILSSVEGRLEDGTVAKKWTAEYTWEGQIRVQEFPQNTSTVYVYDENAMLAYVKGDGLEPIRIIRSNKRGNFQIKYGEQKILGQSFDGGKITSTTDKQSSVVFETGDDGETKGFTDANGNKITVDYDDLSRLRNVTYPDGTQRKLDYDTEGRVKTYTTRSGDQVNYQYDQKGNMVQKEADGETNVFTYDTEGRLTSAVNSLGRMELQYDTKGFPAAATYLDNSVIQYKYNRLGQRTMMVVENELNITYDYDKFNRLTEVWMQVPTPKRVLHMEYDNKGQIIKRTLGNGGYAKYDYHPHTNWLLSLDNYSPSGSLTSKFEYTYDSRGRIKEVQTINSIWKYRFDSKSQLIYWESTNGDKVKVAYDKNKNRVKLEKNGNNKNYIVNNLNQYKAYGLTKTFEYDNNGNLIEKKNSDGTDVRFQFNSENKLSETDAVSARCKYVYDMVGNLFRKTCSNSQTTFINDPMAIHGDKRIAEKSNGETMYFINGLQMGLVARVNGSDFSDISYFDFDQLGSVVGVTGSDGTVLSSYVYDPFGNIINMYQSPGSGANNRLFLGQWGGEKQHEVDLYMLGDRYYDPEHGRFISPDPIELAGKSTNFYVYAENNPVLFRDASGRIVPAVIAVGAIVGAVTNAAITGVSSYVQTGSVDWAGVAGATVSGAITGAGITLGASVAAGGMAITAGIGFVGGVAGYGTTQAINGGGFDPATAAIEGLWNGATALLPTSMLRYRGRGATAFGRIPNTSFLRTLLSRNKTGRSILLSLLVGNLIGNTRPLLNLIKNGLLHLLQLFLDWIRSLDPNDMIGPAGYGDAGYLPPDYLMEYKIRFENDPNATAPAQKVLIKYAFDDDLDIRTFKIGGFGFGNFTKELSFDRPIMQDVINLTETKGLFVRIRAGVNVVSKEATWELQTLDPDSGQQPDDPRFGFLPPNNGTTGQGFVTFQVKPKKDVVSMTRIDAKAVIFFDQNEPIETPPIYNTIDNDNPEVNVSVDATLAEDTGTSVLKLQKADRSSGVNEVDLYLKEGSTTTPLMKSVTEDIVVVPLNTGGSYQILATAVDNVGNQLALEDATVMVIDVPEFKGLSCDQLNNCSGHGNCSSLGLCQCQDGYYGTACNSTIPVAEPPIVEASIAQSKNTEDSPISMHLSARLADDEQSAYEKLHITVSGFPAGFAFSKGELVNGVLTLNETDFGTMTMTPKTDFSGNVTLSVSAVVKDTLGNEAVRSVTLTIDIVAVADLPLLLTSDTCFSGSSGSMEIALNITALPSDEDGSEKVHLELRGIPDTYTLSPKDSVKATEDGFEVDDWDDLKVIVNGQFLPFTIDVTAVSTETSSGDSSMSAARVLNITVCEDVSVSETTVETATNETTTIKTTTVKETTMKAGAGTHGLSVINVYLMSISILFRYILP